MEVNITLDENCNRVQLFGPADANLRAIRQFCDVHIVARDGKVKISGKKEAVAKAADVLDQMQKHLKKNEHLRSENVTDFIRCATASQTGQDQQEIPVYVAGRVITPKTQGQRKYIEAMQQNDLVFCAGPAGTGKTYLAVALAVSLLKTKKIRRLILARPAVEAGEKLGFLPGDMQAKVNPYLRPLFDALGDMMDYEQTKRFMLNDLIEVIPLAFMRGRTLNDSAVILDEAQNTTVSQMLMFLTRLGHDSKMIVTGDDSQIDLETDKRSGLIDAQRRLKGIKGIGFIRLGKADIVRHRLVQNIVMAYENNNGNGNVNA